MDRAPLRLPRINPLKKRCCAALGDNPLFGLPACGPGIRLGQSALSSRAHG
jgi:hypothetical protein